MTVRGMVRGAAALGVAALMLAACAPGTSGAGDNAGDETTLTVWSWRTEDVDEYNKIFDVYEKKHPNVTVEFKAFKNDTYNTKLKTGITTAQGPDVAQLRAYGELQPLAAANRLVPLDQKVDFSGFSEQVLDGARGREDGKVYGVPFAIQTLQVFYNKKIFAEHGISVPQTWDQMIAAAKKLEKAGVIPFSTTGKDFWMLPIIREIFGATRAGGQQFAEAVLAGRTDFTDTDYVASLQLLKDLQPYFPDDVVGVPYTDAQVLFTSGKAAMYPGGSFELAFFEDQAPDLEMGIFQVPPAPGAVVDRPLTPGWVDGSYGVSAESDNKKAATELVRWMATKEFGQLFTDELKQVSPVPEVEPTDPLLAKMISNYEQNPTPYLMLTRFRYGDPTGDDVEGNGIQALFLGKKTAKEVAADVQQGVSQWFEPEG